ncbi:protein SMALL AUXIN UP-REGULATED RNA 51-like [Bidens hawaiensis]|uniref:protein SMALL AUXIN UP-REGULATED RNA 51-like n=1 Tax=Bidens hawaiensis TaxID=980011 RepID=UPI004048EF48
MPSPAKKGNKINQIVRLKQVMQRWRRRCITSESDTDTEQQQQLPSAGSLAVYVGPDRHRFVIPTRFLNLPVFLSLLNKAEEEFGFQTTGGLVIPCDVSFFKWLLNVLNRNVSGVSGLDLDDFMAMFADTEIDVNEHCKEVNNCFTPLLEKARV